MKFSCTTAKGDSFLKKLCTWHLKTRKEKGIANTYLQGGINLHFIPFSL